jgi:hypothetical protein
MSSSSEAKDPYPERVAILPLATLMAGVAPAEVR